MRTAKILFAGITVMALLLAGCASMSKTQKGAAVSTANEKMKAEAQKQAEGNKSLLVLLTIKIV